VSSLGCRLEGWGCWIGSDCACSVRSCCGGVCCSDSLNPTHAYWISGFKGIYAILETLYSLANSLASGGKRATNWFPLWRLTRRYFPCRLAQPSLQAHSRSPDSNLSAERGEKAFVCLTGLLERQVEWIRGSQGPANALWMRVWETSQVNRTNTGQHQNHHHHNNHLCVNYPAYDVYKTVASNANNSTIIKNNSTAIPGSGSVAHPLNGNTGDGDMTQKTGSVVDSASSCSKIRTTSANAIAGNNMNKGHPFFTCSENVLNNVNHQHHPPHLRHFNQEQHQQSCMKRHPSHPAAIHTHHHHHHHPGRRKSDNKASTYGINYLLSNWTSNSNYGNSGTPWKTRKYNPGVDGWDEFDL